MSSLEQAVPTLAIMPENVNFMEKKKNFFLSFFKRASLLSQQSCQQSSPTMDSLNEITSIDDDETLTYIWVAFKKRR
jgi:hypothetical protein